MKIMKLSLTIFLLNLIFNANSQVIGEHYTTGLNIIEKDINSSINYEFNSTKDTINLVIKYTKSGDIRIGRWAINSKGIIYTELYSVFYGETYSDLIYGIGNCFYFYNEPTYKDIIFVKSTGIFRAVLFKDSYIVIQPVRIDTDINTFK